MAALRTKLDDRVAQLDTVTSRDKAEIHLRLEELKGELDAVRSEFLAHGEFDREVGKACPKIDGHVQLKIMSSPSAAQQEVHQLTSGSEVQLEDDTSTQFGTSVSQHSVQDELEQHRVEVHAQVEKQELRARMERREQK